MEFLIKKNYFFCRLASVTRILGGAGLCHGLNFESLKAKLYFIRMMTILIPMNKYYFQWILRQFRVFASF